MLPGRQKIGRSIERMAVCLFFFFSVSFWTLDVLSQTPGTGEKRYSAQIGTIGFQIREFEANSSPMRILEVQIEILNRNQRGTVPPNTIKVIVAPREIRFLPSEPPTQFAPLPEEVMLTYSLPPSAARLMIVGFHVPKEKLESISFEVQINPPEGEKKTATYNF